MSATALGELQEYNQAYGGGSPFQSSWPEAATQSYALNELVYLVSGKVTVVATDGTTIWGLAKQAASGTTDTARLVTLLTPMDLLLANAYHGTPASAITAVADLHKKFSVYRDGTNKWHHIDVSDTSNDAWVTVDFERQENAPVGTQYGRYIVKLIPAVIQSEAAAT